MTNQPRQAAKTSLCNLDNHNVRGTNNQPPRQAISGMIVTIILIGIVVSVGGILATTTTDIVTTGLVLDAVEIKRLNIQNTGTVSYVTGMIKNAGNTDVTNAKVIVTLDIGDDTIDQDDIFVAEFSPSTINSGVTATVNQKIFVGDSEDVSASLAASTEDDGVHRLTIGQKYLVEVRADIAGGGEYSQTKIISPQ